MTIVSREIKDHLTELKIASNTVYENEVGDSRLVSSVSNGVVIWRTANADLAHGEKSQGSATVSSFQRWAVRSRQAARQDYSAYSEVLRRRELKQEINKAKRELRRQNNL